MAELFSVRYFHFCTDIVSYFQRGTLTLIQILSAIFSEGFLLLVQRLFYYAKYFHFPGASFGKVYFHSSLEYFTLH